MPATPTHVLTMNAARWSIRRLGGQRIHPAFIYYLYLRKMSVQNALDRASASSIEVQDLVRMPGGPEGRSYYRPLRERGDRNGELLRSFWMQDNIAGSWGPASLKRMSPAAWLVDGTQYVMPDDHAARAKEKLLFGNKVSALAMASYFLRNDGFILDGELVNLGRPEDAVAGFRQKFIFDPIHDPDFYLMFDTTVPDVDFEWFEQVNEATSDDSDMDLAPLAQEN